MIQGGDQFPKNVSLGLCSAHVQASDDGCKLLGNREEHSSASSVLCDFGNVNDSKCVSASTEILHLLIKLQLLTCDD